MFDKAGPTPVRLTDYEITPDLGFLSPYSAESVSLPDYFDPVQKMAAILPKVLTTGLVRARLSRLPVLNLEQFCKDATDAQKRVAMVHYSFLVQSYVWGEPEAPSSLPECLALPIWQLAEAIGQKPLLTYSAYVLDNWAMLDQDGGVDLSNIHMVQHFLGGEDETWFVTVHVAIEATAGKMLEQIPHSLEAVENDDPTALLRSLRHVSETWDSILAIFDRMPERCDPFIYYQRVRPWIHGWKDNPALGKGLVYEGVKEAGDEPQAFRGQTGSQSSIVPTMDAFFGIQHASDPMKAYLDELHAYRPPAHRAFIDAVRAKSTVREYIANHQEEDLRALYNDCISKLAHFRTKHLEYAASYINKQAKSADGNDTDIGTGGTPFMKYLKKHRDEVNQQLLNSKL
ncbi:MAG: hypothetical protein JJ850_18250 [Kordiimonadaceae bacterium]|nr:hypothetical protein [Kordiimonadaceae bacterium]MBO6570574.1 hypothetical protein [Kordiimonadaceae bacterium]MBO6966568.1 hypothetical protein [Kordiimonadaceae bacterium]